jgi:hypothetical protein
MNTKAMTRFVAVLAFAVSLNVVPGNAAAQKKPKINTDVLSTNKLDNVATAKLPKKLNMKQINRSISGLDSLSGKLDRALRDFKTQHGQTINVARALVRKDNECFDRIYSRGQITAAERRASCPSIVGEVYCKNAVFERCRSRHKDDYELSLVQLERKRSELQCLLYDYGEGASADAQAELLGVSRGTPATAPPRMPNLPSLPSTDFRALQRMSGCR